ncbi:MAG: glycosyltransferase family 2 protein [Saccharofermentanales bacterium]
MMVDLTIALIGMIFCILLFYRISPPDGHSSESLPLKVSIVIPARNEERNLPLLLEDIRKQTVRPFEIICVDDGSTDRTPEIVLQYGAVLVEAEGRPDGWIGKSWACHTGAHYAAGDLILFLDADVRLLPDALGELCSSYQVHGGVISVQPYHHVSRIYEQFSLFFNLVQMAGNGMGFYFKKNRIGLFGPVIMISKMDYLSINGHFGARNSITDDLALGERLKKHDIAFSLFLGDKSISYRMYESGMAALIQGWTKNFATGASKTPPATFLAVFAWITSCSSVTINLILSLLSGNLTHIALWLGMYAVWTAILFVVTAKAGSYSKIAVLFYPVPLIVFLLLFIVSLAKKVLHLRVVWKDRSIDIGG